MPPDVVLVVDSSSGDATVEVAQALGARTLAITREQFSHGGTRHLACEQIGTDIVCFMTQDALPADQDYLQHLVAPFADPLVAMVSGRQLPRDDARRREQLVRTYSYPARSEVRSAEDVYRLGMRAFHASNVCSAYRRSAYEAVGGFERDAATNEDMLIAAHFLWAGYRIAYAADACVIHSHDLTLAQQFARNRAIGAFLQEHAEDFASMSEMGAGGQVVSQVVRDLVREGRVMELAEFALDCAARLAGNRTGRMEARLRRGRTR